MTIDEAIKALEDEILVIEQTSFLSYVPADTQIKAIRLGIEALKRLKEHIDLSYRALPGETEN